jgi:cell division septum initiation protein DivIVA
MGHRYWVSTVENKKLKQDVDELTAQLKEKDEGIQHLTATMERMRIEVMEAHDAQQFRGGK